MSQTDTQAGTELQSLDASQRPPQGAATTEVNATQGAATTDAGGDSQNTGRTVGAGQPHTERPIESDTRNTSMTYTCSCSCSPREPTGTGIGLLSVVTLCACGLGGAALGTAFAGSTVLMPGSQMSNASSNDTPPQEVRSDSESAATPRTINQYSSPSTPSIEADNTSICDPTPSSVGATCLCGILCYAVEPPIYCIFCHSRHTRRPAVA
uniref:Uncharacterized protein n=1 Tax=Kwoniella bestiolae CBS 10118 TaxID=1296100 RepID=A0A1B9FW97_9TREE|nr:hypothetical protein I302_07397 [Kwoniella bestiolae CBS 10118]OCF23047.1 hypothetical protein I302_07397 [Kwoniella bestiolae CBS 10118]